MIIGLKISHDIDKNSSKEGSYQVSTMRRASYDANKEVFQRRNDLEFGAAITLGLLNAGRALFAGRDSIQVSSVDAKSCPKRSCCCASDLECSSNERILPDCQCCYRWRTGGC